MPGGPVVVHFFGGAADRRRRGAHAPCRDRRRRSPARSSASRSVRRSCVVAACWRPWRSATGPAVDRRRRVHRRRRSNLILGAVSLMPAFPARRRPARHAAIAWARTRRPATRARGLPASPVGAVGRTLAMIGVAVVDPHRRDAIDGIMIALVRLVPRRVGPVGRSLARSSTRSLEGIRVGEAMEHDLATISPQLTLDTFAGGVLDGSARRRSPVLRDDMLVGMVGAAQVRRVPRTRLGVDPGRGRHGRRRDAADGRTGRRPAGGARPAAPSAPRRPAGARRRRRLTGIVTRRSIARRSCTPGRGAGRP